MFYFQHQSLFGFGLPLDKGKIGIFLFLILALSDLFGLIYRHYLYSGNSNYSVLISVYFLFISLFDKETFYKNTNKFAFSFILLILLSIFVDNRYFDAYVVVFIHIAALYLIIKQFYSNCLSFLHLDLFFVILITYELLNIFKLLNLILDLKIGHFYLWLSYFIQMFMGVFFSFVKPENPKFTFRIIKKTTEK